MDRVYSLTSPVVIDPIKCIYCPSYICHNRCCTWAGNKCAVLLAIPFKTNHPQKTMELKTILIKDNTDKTSVSDAVQSDTDVFST